MQASFGTGVSERRQAKQPGKYITVVFGLSRRKIKQEFKNWEKRRVVPS
jgi:hypothetical protein